MANCLLLAFENAKDLGDDLCLFKRVDAYGPLADIELTQPMNLHIFKQFFWIENYKKPKEKYATCIIYHPDIWGEPINWIRAIAAIAECVEGNIVCEFWMPSEIIAFNFFLTSIIKDNVRLLSAKKISSRSKIPNFRVEWKIRKTKNGMLSFYRRNKMSIMYDFYHTIGKLYWQLPFEEAERMLNKKIHPHMRIIKL
ncbi:MAG: hypothetical protein QXL94_03130 [Candidatus Parvarchaeum sp.]